MFRKFLDGLIFGTGFGIALVAVWSVSMFHVIPRVMESVATHTRTPNFETPTDAQIATPDPGIAKRSRDFSFFKSQERMKIPEGGGILAMAPKKSIVRAFSGVERPTGLDLASHDCEECEDVRQRLSPHGFEGVADADVDWLSDALPLLGPKGLNYYLPAFLLRALREPEWEGVELLMYHLSPTWKDLTERPDYWRERLGVFSPEQHHAVLAFLSWLESSPAGAQYDSEIGTARDIWTKAA